MSTALSVLIVDDERDTAEVYAQQLTAEYDVSTASYSTAGCRR